MPNGRPAIPFFTDQNVPDSVGDAIVEAGHVLTRLRDAMDVKTADTIIGIACAENCQVLVSHDKDFRSTSKRLGLTQRQYQKNLHCVHMRCPEPSSAQRIRDAMSIIEFEWSLVQQDRPMVIEIHAAAIRICR
jgi:predicted nuclease of predicted toxin-antitoxin system